LIVCPYDTTDTILNASKSLTISNWTWPSNYGDGALLGKVLSMAWTD